MNISYKFRSKPCRVIVTGFFMLITIVVLGTVGTYASEGEINPLSKPSVRGDQNDPPYEYLDENGRPAGYNVDLTRAIAQSLDLDIDENGEHRRISDKWLGVYADSTPNFLTVFRYVAMVAVPLLLLVFGFFLWSWSLRKQVALRESERQYRLLADNVSDVIWTMNLKQRFTYVSPSIQKLLGYTPEEAGQVPLKNTLTPESYAKVVQVITKAIARDAERKGAKDVTLSLELEHIRKDGGTLWVEITTSFIRDEGGLLSGFIGITRDITARKQAEEQRDKLISDLEKALGEVKTLSKLLPICSHCKNIRDDKGDWSKIESYIHKHSDTQFSHGICPECAKKHYPDMDLYEDAE